MKTTLQWLHIDSTQAYAFDEPPFMLRGIEIRLGDTCTIKLYTERTPTPMPPDKILSRRQCYELMLSKKVVGVSWRKPHINRRAYIGKIIPYYEYR